MTYRTLRPAGLALAGFGLLAALGACATPAASPFRVTAANDDTRLPVVVAAVVVEEDGPQVNQWGGIVPDAKPTTPVDDGGLGEIGG